MHRVPYRIETPRLVLRCWSPEDAPAVHAAIGESRAHLKRFMPWAHREASVDDTVETLARFRASFDGGEEFVFGVFDKDAARVVGGTGLHPDGEPTGMKIGYWVHVAHVRRGIATEVAGALTRVGFEIVRVRWLEIRVARENVASAGVPPKLGFALHGTLPGRLDLGDGRSADALVFGMLADDYATSAAKNVDVRAFDGAGRRVL